MVISKNVLHAFPGVDLTIGLKYVPPVTEGRSGLTISASLVHGSTVIAPDSISFSPVTGEINAIWQESATSTLIRNQEYEARFVRIDSSGNSRVFYIRPVIVK